MRISLISMDQIVGSMGLRSISSCLKYRGHNVQMIFLLPYERFDCNSSLSLKVLDELIDLVKNSDVIGISSMSGESKTAIQVISYLKKLNKSIVWGGIHPTGCPDECINYADIICIGEGEEAFCELIEAMEKKIAYFDIRNFWFKKNGQVIRNPVRHLIQDLDSLPFSDYESHSHYILQENTIINAIPYYNTLSSITIHTARGCPSNCSFCCNSFVKKLYLDQGKIVRKRSIESIIKELRDYKDKFPSLGSVWFTDDSMFIRTIAELKVLVREYKKKINLPFMCYVSPDTFNEDKLKLLLNAGLYRLEMGIQTGSEDINKNIYHRNISNKTILTTSRTISKYKMKMAPPNYQIIFCNPYETKKDLIATINLLRKLSPPFFLKVFALQFFPSSELYKKAKREGLSKEDNFINYNDSKKALELTTKERYLNFVLYLMSGAATPERMGKLPRLLFGILLNKKIIDYFKRHEKELLSFMNKALNTYGLILTDELVQVIKNI